MRKKLILLGMVLLIGLFLVGCSNNDDQVSEVNMIEASGAATVNIPEAGAGPVTVLYTAKVIDQNGNQLTGEGVTWAVEDVNGNDVNSGFVSIDSYGVVTVTSEAAALQDSFKVIAISETNTDISGDMIVSLDKVPAGTSAVTMIEVSGAATMNIPEAGAAAVTVPYTAAVLDQNGDQMTGEEVNWTVEDVNGTDVTNGFVNIAPDGVVEVTSDASAQLESFRVVATSVTNTGISGQQIVSLESISSLSPVNLGTAGNYVILSSAGITNVPISAITGDIGVSPIASTAITGFSLTMDSSGEFSTSAEITGRVYAANYVIPTPSKLTTAVSDMGTAYTDAAGRAADFTNLHAGDLSGQTLEPGVYKWGTGVSINSDVTLSGTATDVWIFQISGQLLQAAGTSTILTGGALPENVFWQVAETVSIGANAHLDGIVLEWNNVTLGTGASVNGRLFALNENVTLIENTIVEP